MFKLIKNAAFVFAVFCGANSFASAQTQTFGAWTVTVKTDQFEGEARPKMTASILDTNGRQVGVLTIDYFRAYKGQFYAAFFLPRMEAMDSTFPACHFQYLRYKLDDGAADFFPKTDDVCPLLVIGPKIGGRMSQAKSLRFTAMERVGIVNLEGFSDAWAYSIGRVEKKQ
jgi:hypothetical protein